MNLPTTVSCTLGIALALALATIATLPLAAQRRADRPEIPEIDDRLAAEMKTRAGELVADYWTPKLNDYRVRIDRTLTPTDLDELNRLRVRFSIIMGDHIQQKADQKSPKMMRNTDGEMKIRDDEEMRKATEFMEIYASTKDLAGRYQADLQTLGGTVIDDVIHFTDMMAGQSAQFITDHRAEMTPEQVTQYTAKVQAFSETVNELKADREGQMGLAAIYTFAIEPIIMLYNGADLRELLQQVGGIGKPIAGLELPESGVLNQNFPNPAATTTSIGYNLAEASSRTTLRLYASDGSIAKSLDLGARPAGEQTVEVDVSGLATGTYLYQLMIQTGAGEQVFAKRMQVVR
jgi:hypothetical protein